MKHIMRDLDFFGNKSDIFRLQVFSAAVNRNWLYDKSWTFSPRPEFT